MSAKGLDERGFLWVLLGKAFFFSDGWTGVTMVLTGCQRVYRMEKNKCHKGWPLQIEWDLFMQACHKIKTFFIEIKKKMLLWIVWWTFSGVISRTVFHCPTVLLQLDWVSTKTWKDLVCTRVFECLRYIFFKKFWAAVLQQKWRCITTVQVTYEQVVKPQFDLACV